MFLSNRHAAALSILVIIFATAGCAWFGGSNSNVETAIVSVPVSAIPFETKEPEIYQADHFTISGETETRSHFARKGSKWRFDSFDSDRPVRSMISNEKLIYVDHASKTYSEAPTGGGQEQPPFLADITASLLTQKPPAKFEKIGAEGKIETYRVTADGATTPSVIAYDTEIRMVVRHEIGDGFAFEMRNFILEVDDSKFQMPAGYRKIAWPDFIKK